MNQLKRVARILTLRCEDASRLASSQMDGPLDLADRLALAGHRLICKSCRRFGSQLRILRDIARTSIAETAALTPEAKDRMRTAIAEAKDGLNGPTPNDRES